MLTWNVLVAAAMSSRKLCAIAQYNKCLSEAIAIITYYDTLRPWITMECSQPAAWTTNRSLLVASRVRSFQEDRPIPTRPYPELRTWMVVRSGVISVFPTHSGNAPVSPDIRPTTWLCPACLPSTNSTPAPIQPTIAMTTTHIHQLWLTRPPSTRSSSASEDHPQAPVVTQQQQQRHSDV